MESDAELGAAGRASGWRVILLVLLGACLAQGQPSDSDALLEQGLAAAKTSDYATARRILEQGSLAYPRDPRFRLELAGVAYREKRPGTAKAHLRKALRLDPGNAYGAEFLGLLYLLDGNLAAALQYWNRVRKPLVQEVSFAPAPPLKPLLRDRTFTISGGQLLTLRRLQATEQNLARLGMGGLWSPELTPRDDGRYDLLFRSAGDGPRLGGWLGRVVPVARGLAYQALHLDRDNLGERGIQLRSLWRWDPEKRRALVTLSSPIAQDPRRGFRLGVDARDENWDLTRTLRPGIDNLQLRRAEAWGDLVFALGDSVQWTTGLAVTRRTYGNSGADALFTSSWSFEIRNRFDRVLVQLPEHRLAIEGYASLRTGRQFAGVTSRFAIPEAGASGVWHPQARGERWTVRASLRGGNAFGRIPFDEYFQLGMERDNALWLRGQVGTRAGRKGNAPLGTRYGLVQTELGREVARLLFLRLEVGPFVDAGWVDRWYGAAGVQARLSAGRVTWTFVYGRDVRRNAGAFYTGVSR